MRNKKKRSYVGILSSVFVVVIGLLVRFVVLFLCSPFQALPEFGAILTGVLTHGMRGIGWMSYYATPIILTGLSIGFAFKTGLLGIDTPGQFLVGSFGAVYVGILWINLGRRQWVAALMTSIIFGAVWGLAPGLLKACFNVSEITSSIMMNYISLYLVNWIVRSYKPLFNNLRNGSKSVAANAVIPRVGMGKLFLGSSVSGGIIIAIIVMIIIYIVLSRTTFGFELKAVGFNQSANKHVSISEKQSIIESTMTIGTIADLAGGLLCLAGIGKHIEMKDVFGSERFTGISVALLGLSHPIGVLLSDIFIACLTVDGFYFQLFEFSTEIIDIIMAVIIYFDAFALIVKSMTGKFQKRKDGGNKT